MRHESLARKRHRRLALGVALGAATTLGAAVTAAGVLSSSPSSTAASAQPETGQTATITVDTSGQALGKLNTHYAGFSFESYELYSGKLDNVGNLAHLMRNLGSPVMRIGGFSADDSYTLVTPDQLAGLDRLAAASGWTVLYTENIGHLNVAAITSNARAVSHTLGSSLSAFACGNEPDQFHRDGLRPSTYSESDYLSEAANCIAAIRAGAPNAPLEGPDTVSEPSWPTAYAVSDSGLIDWFGIHFYPLPCGLQGQTPAQRARQLLSQASTAREVWWFTWAANDAKAAHAELWMTEVNTACGGGDKGLSNSFVSALWIIDYLLLGAEHGVRGMNVQGGLSTNCQGYSPLCEVSSHEYRAQPIYYGMLFTHLLGSGDLLPVTVTPSSPGQNLTAFALRPDSGGGLRIMVENLSQDPADVTIQVGHSVRAASVLHLTAPSLLATSGVAIQGSTVAADGSFRPGTPETVACSAQGCPVTVSPYTAILLTLDT